MFALEVTTDDDPAFLDLASRLITGVAVAHEFRVLVAVHVDHWFGPRWLGFCGKLLGAAGVHNRRLTDDLRPPPFHPHRVRSARAYQVTESGRFEFWEDIRSLHDFRSSGSNFYRKIGRGRLYVWYTGDTAASDKAAVMAYLVARDWNAAWYVGFDKFPTWHVSKTVAVAPRRIQKLMELVSPAQQQAEPATLPDHGGA